VATKKKTETKGRAARGNTKPVTTEQQRLESWKSDIVGVVIIVLGIVFLLACVMRNTGVVTDAIATGLFIAFGIGAYILPILLIILGITFFIPKRLANVWRTGAGLGVALLGIISLLALATPEAAYLDSELIRQYGGYTGGGIAWLLDYLTGPVIARVILGALVLIGVLITGFSLSDFIRYLWVKHVEKQTVKRNALKDLDPKTARVGRDQKQRPERRARAHTTFADEPFHGEPSTEILPEKGRKARRAEAATEVLAPSGEQAPSADETPTLSLDEPDRVKDDGFALPDYGLLKRSTETNPRTIAVKDGELQAIADKYGLGDLLIKG